MKSETLPPDVIAQKIERHGSFLTNKGPEGLHFDFNDGCRVSLPPGDWHVTLRDMDTKSVLFSSPVAQGVVQSSKRYYLKFEIEVKKDGRLIFSHEMNLEGRPVLIKMRQGGIGDHLAWMGHVAEFQRRHKCVLTCVIRPDLLELLQAEYPDVRLVSSDEEAGGGYYASYNVLIFYNDSERNHTPIDYRAVGLEKNAALILGLAPISRRPTVKIQEGGRPVAEPYVCLATQATSQAKYWNNPVAWRAVIQFLKKSGYRVFCIDRERVNGRGTIWNYLPHGVEDLTGPAPLSERARWLKHADFFVGLSSGLSWLAWASETPVVMISGFTASYNEFETPYRVLNWNVCNGCSNDIRCQLDVSDFFWCPRLGNTDRRFECTRGISPDQVIETIKTIPGFRKTAS
ncbi:autotransporter strand-loop-strand O-heptosyltransferase [Acetobacter sacchari]|uniref:Autotransporter strand-loop-strand O-heptosyltransferase n=1 Tax=Acetobacter sacchari TaxID=2661687 RepID=A0ABS3M159_9PROT|nr:autotransporter strand-loop-strand O-heptosyltransferase [Acetobacter sacchari]MBO1361878.1 autotransporter strand-loop-strand O-heptosyltransferase [Acetobacter sacchari]